MTCSAYTIKGRRILATTTGAIAFVLSLSVSHSAMAACTGSVPAAGSVNTIPSGSTAANTILCSGVGAAGAGTADTPFVVDGTSTNPNLHDSSVAKAVPAQTGPPAVPAVATSNNTLLQFNGHGRVLTNSGEIINDRYVDDKANTRSRTAVMMGASTVNAGATTSFTPASTVLPASGSDPVRTVVTLGPTFTSANADTAVAQYTNQSLVLGGFDGDDFAPNKAFQILSAQKVQIGSTSNYNVVVTVAGDATGFTATDQRYSVVSNFGGKTEVGGVFYNNVIQNTGTISASIGTTTPTGYTLKEIEQNKSTTANPFTSTSYTAAVTGITSSVAGTYIIENGATGKILATHAGIGALQAIFEGGQVTTMTINNSGLIGIERQAPLSLTSVTANAAAQATSSNFAGYAAQNVGNGWAIGTEEEAEGIKVNNLAGGTIQAKGDYTASIYSRAEEATIVNRGAIEHLSSVTFGKTPTELAAMTDAEKYGKGFAIGAVSNGGGVRELELENYGTIKGDILGVNGNAFRWYMLSTEGVVSTNSSNVTTANLAAGKDARLVINSHTGQLNSEIENKASGKIIGNFWLSNGAHEIENEGEVVGNIDVDQRATLVNAIATACTNSSGATSTNCVGSIGSTSTPVLTPGVVMDDDDPTKKVSDIYRIVTTRTFGSGSTAATSTITESVTVTAGEREFEIENSGKMTGNITVNQVQANIYTLPDVQACTIAGNTACPATATTGTPTTGSAIASTFTDGVKITSTTTTTPYGTSGNPNAAANGHMVALSGVTIDLTSTGVAALSRKFTFENSGLFDGNITIQDSASSENKISLSGDGFGRKADGTVNALTGNIAATNGTGNNILNLDGEGTLRGNVSNFSTLNVLGEAVVDDDDDDDAGSAGGTFWTLAAGKTFQFHNANVQGGTLNVLGNLYGTTEIAEGAVLTGTGTVHGNVGNSGTIDLDDHTLHVAGNVLFRDESVLATTISGSGNGLLAVTGTTTFQSESSVVASIDDARVRNGDSYKIVSTTGGVVDLPEVEDTSALLKWSPIVDGNDLYITAEVDANKIAGISKPGAAAITALLGSDNELGDEVLLIQNEDDVRKAGNQLAPDTNFAKQQVALALNQATGQQIDGRLASVGATGTSSFAPPSGLGMKQNDPNRSNLGARASVAEDGSGNGMALWGRAFGSGLQQDERENVDGYDARLYGVLAGYDNWVAPGVRVGVAVGYANATIDGDGTTAQNSTDINSYLAELYGTYKGAGWYASGRTGYTWHDYDVRRVLTVPVGDVANGDYDGRQYNAAIELGAPMRAGGGSVFTPVASLTYSRLDQDSYTETSGNGMALAVESQSSDSLVSGLGVKAQFPLAADTVLEARAIWLHEFSDTAETVTASFASGGGTFTAAGPDVGRDSASLGVGLLATIGPDSTFQLNYDATVREDFLAHVGSAQLTYRY